MSASDAHLDDGGSQGSMEVTDHSTAGTTRPLEDAGIVGRNVVQRRTILPPSGPPVSLPIGASPTPGPVAPSTPHRSPVPIGASPLPFRTPSGRSPQAKLPLENGIDGGTV